MCTQLWHYLDRHAALRATTVGEKMQAESSYLWPWRHLFHRIDNADDIYIALNCPTYSCVVMTVADLHYNLRKILQTYNAKRRWFDFETTYTKPLIRSPL